MREMSDADASFLYFETPATHMHVLATVLLDVSADPHWSAENLALLLQRRIGAVRPFRQRLAPATMRLHHPVWIDVSDVDVHDHLTVLTCPTPGTMSDLAAVVAEFASHQLDRSRPLWHCLVVEGLADGRAAAVFKVHHSAIDGVGATRLLTSLVDLAPGAAGADEDALDDRGSTSEGAPSSLHIATHTATRLAQKPWQALRFGIGAYKSLTEVLTRRVLAGPRVEVARPSVAPRVPFNGAITAGRTLAFVDLELEDIKTIKAAVDGTFNDAITAVTGGALRRYLMQRDELPSSSLIAVIPVSTRGDSSDDAANRTSAMFSSLGTHLEDPLERLRAVRKAHAAAKQSQSSTGSSLITWASAVVPPLTNTALARMYSAARVANFHPTAHNLVLSNVAGPPFEVYLAGAMVEGIFPAGPIMEGPALNITLVSYRDRVGVGIIASSLRMPAVDVLASAFPFAVQELLDAVALGKP